MKHLAMIAHGSRNSSANEELTVLAAHTQLQLREQYQGVHACYLEMAKPSLSEMCQQLIAEGATSIDVYPLFLNSGRHASEDIPNEVASLRQSNPQIVFKLLPYLGQNPEFADVVCKHILSNP